MALEKVLHHTAWMGNLHIQEISNYYTVFCFVFVCYINSVLVCELLLLYEYSDLLSIVIVRMSDHNQNTKGNPITRQQLITVLQTQSQGTNMNT